ncbi:MAG: hypothetical protein ACI358_05410 [Candidatus Limimorpha sp.]
MRKFLLLCVCVSLFCACGSNGQSSQEESKNQQQEEVKTIPASSVMLKGKHAILFKVSGDSCKVSLVKVDGYWQVRVKMTIANKKSYNQLSDKSKYERNLSGINGKLLNASEVELSSLDVSSEEWNMLLEEGIDAQQDITIKTYSFERYSYARAKEIFDNVVGVELRGIELREAENRSNNNESLFDDETWETVEDMQMLLEAESEMFDVLKKFF